MYLYCGVLGIGFVLFFLFELDVLIECWCGYVLWLIGCDYVCVFSDWNLIYIFVIGVWLFGFL